MSSNLAKRNKKGEVSEGDSEKEEEQGRHITTVWNYFI